MNKKSKLPPRDYWPCGCARGCAGGGARVASAAGGRCGWLWCPMSKDLGCRFWLQGLGARVATMALGMGP